MIVQTAATGDAHFVITQVDHARASGILAKAFGNVMFAELNPCAAMEYVVAHHDEGWADLDAQAMLDLETRLPYHLTKTPILKLIETGDKSPNHNEAHNPYAGLISSMHTWGLYHGRYGLSDKVFINTFPAEHRPAVDAMLAGEEARQAKLKAQLAVDLATAAWVDERVLFHNYKLLQFFDTLSLYFHTAYAGGRGESHFLNVPRAVGDDVQVTVTPLGVDVYRVMPFPFNDEVIFTTQGRYIKPLAEGDDLAQVMVETPYSEQTVRLVE